MKNCRYLELESENLALRLRNSSLESEKQKLQSDLDTVLEKSKAVVILNARLVRKVMPHLFHNRNTILVHLMHAWICKQIMKLTSKSLQSPSSVARSTAGILSSDSDVEESVGEPCHNSAGTCATSFVQVAGQRNVADTANESGGCHGATVTEDHERNGSRAQEKLSVANEFKLPVT